MYKCGGVSKVPPFKTGMTCCDWRQLVVKYVTGYSSVCIYLLASAPGLPHSVRVLIMRMRKRQTFEERSSNVCRLRMRIIKTRTERGDLEPRLSIYYSSFLFDTNTMHCVSYRLIYLVFFVF